MLSFAVLAALAVPSVYGAAAPTFAPPGAGPTSPSANYTGASNGTLQNTPLVPGAAFDRFIQIWFENTDYASAASSPVLAALAQHGIVLDNYVAVTHPSEPNYVAAVGGDFWGMGDDDYYHIPSNISTIVDLLDAKNISWASYQESMPTDGFTGYNYSSPNYLNSSAGDYVYYVRKHNPLIIYDSVATVPERAMRQRNFNDFAADVDNNTLPQWIWITPNLVNDAHDTTIDFASDFMTYWFIPLLTNPNFNTNRTLILLTFDETETYTVKNTVYSLLLGGAVPASAYNTTDSTFYSHYSALSTVEANWKLGSLGRQDTNKTMSNVFSYFAPTLGYTNENVTNPPFTNLTGNIPGPLNAQYYVPFLAPNNTAVGAGGGPVFVASGINPNLTAASAPAPVNLTALGEEVPSAVTTSMPMSSSSSTASPSPSPTSSGSALHANSFGSVLAALSIVVAMALVL